MLKKPALHIRQYISKACQEKSQAYKAVRQEKPGLQSYPRARHTKLPQSQAYKAPRQKEEPGLPCYHAARPARRAKTTIKLALQSQAGE